jgi:hypothetical protein
LTNRLTKYRGALNEINKKYGNYTLEVGNYEKGTRNLNFAMAQISRELPNFGQSFQIGVLSLTNNIGHLLDGINQVKAQNIELKNQGKATQSIFKTILAGIFSFQTLLFVGIGLISAYSGEIEEWAKNLFRGEKAIKSVTDAGREFAEENAQAIGRLQSLVSATQDVTLSDEQRLKALELINDEYPELNANMSLEDSNLKSLNKSVDIYIESLLKKVRVEQLNVKIGEQIIEIAKIDEKAMKLKSKLTAQQIKDAENWNGSIQKLYMTESGNQRVLGSYEKYIIAITEAREAREGLKSVIEGSDLTEQLTGGGGGDIDPLKNTVAWYQKLISANNELIDNKKTLQDIDSVRKLQKENEEYQKQIDLIQGNVKHRKEEKILLEGSIAFMQEHISKLEEERNSLATSSREYGQRTNEIIKATAAMELFILASQKVDTISPEGMDDFIKGLDKIQADSLKEIGKTAESEFGRFADAVANGNDAVRELQQQTDNFLLSFTQDTPLQSMNQFFDGSFKMLMAGAETTEEKFAVTFNSIAEVAQEAFEIINQASQARFEADMYRLEQQRDISIQFAGDSTAAREEIERQYEIRRRQIQRKQAEDAKKAAIYNSIINTAQAVVGALAATPGPAGIAFAIAVGLIGLAQTALIASTKIPAFKDGVRDFKGGMAIVGDGGVSEVVESNGKAYSTPSTDTLVNLPKGANVYKNKQEYFNEKLNDLLAANMIQPIPFNINTEVQDSGLSYEDMDRVMGKYFKNLQVNQTTLDKNGFNSFIRQGNAKTNRLNNRVTGKGLSV